MATRAFALAECAIRSATIEALSRLPTRMGLNMTFSLDGRWLSTRRDGRKKYCVAFKSVVEFEFGMR